MSAIRAKKSPTSHLTNLPTELLFIIFHHLETSALSSLARTCHHLNMITESVHLGRLGLVNVGSLCVLRSDHRRFQEQIAVLSTSFALTGIERVVCIMEHNKQQSGDWKTLTTRIRHIHHFLARLSFVGSFSIVFTLLDGKWSAAVAQKFLQKFLSAFFDLLEVVISKSPSSLQINHPEGLFPNMQFRSTASCFSEPTSIKLKKLIRGNFRSQAPQERSGKEATLVSYRPPISIQTQLTKLDLHSDLLLLPPYSSWTTSMLQNSRVISLTVSRHRSVTKDIFYLMLFPPLVQSVGVSLRELKVAFHNQASLATVVENLPLLPFLETLVLGITSLGIPPATPKKPTYLHLSNLVSFTGSLEQAAYLFEHPMACVNLTQVNLIIDLYYETPINLYPEKARCFTVLNNALSALGVNPKVVLCISTEGQPRPLNFFTPTDHPNSATIFSRVSSMTLDIPLGHPDGEEVQALEKILDLLVMFHAVTTLSVILRPLQPKKKYAVPQPQKGKNEERNSRLISAIASEHPNITCNIIDLLPNRYHFHWSNARDEISRGIDFGLPPITSHRQKSTAWCVCSDF